MAFPLFSTLQQRYQDLLGDSDGTIDNFGKRNINAAISDIVNRYPFSWNVASTTLTLSSGTADMPNNFNPRWGLMDARIVVSDDNNDTVFTQVPIYERDKYSSDDYVFWITPDISGDKYVFNTKTQTGTVTIYYYYVPTELSSDSDKCAVPDTEAVSYLAASKNWIGAERDEALEAKYREIADRHINALYLRDLQQSADIEIQTLSAYNLGA